MLESVYLLSVAIYVILINKECKKLSLTGLLHSMSDEKNSFGCSISCY